MRQVVAIGLLAALGCSPESVPMVYPDGRSPPPVGVSSGPPGPGTGTGTGTATAGCQRPGKAGAAQQTIAALGRERTFTVVVPDGYAPHVPYPLVFVLHGGGGTAALARTQTDLENVSGGRAVFVYPDAIGGNWDLDSPTSANRDVALFDAISLLTTNALCIDTHRVFVTGFSNGAYMANQLACKRGDHIRGIAIHAGGGPYENKGTYDARGNLICPGKAVAALVVHGNSDGTVAPAEGQKSVDHWSQSNRCSAGSAPMPIPPCVALADCFQPVGLCRIPSLGHGLWKDAGKATWSFFDSLR